MGEKVKKLVLSGSGAGVEATQPVAEVLAELIPVDTGGLSASDLFTDQQMDEAFEGVSTNDLMADGFYDVAMRRIYKEHGGDRGWAMVEFESYYEAAERSGRSDAAELSHGDVVQMLDRIDRMIAQSGEREKAASAEAAAEPAEKKAPIDQDPYEREKFARKLIDYQSDMLDACWRMREHLASARPYMNDSATFLTLIDQLDTMAAEMQKQADLVRDIGIKEKKHAEYLIAVFEDIKKLKGRS